MNIEDPQWDAYETRFRAISDNLALHKGPVPEIANATIMLCLYGDNGMSVEEEFDTLMQLEARPADIKGLEMLTSYWEDIVLYIV